MPEGGELCQVNFLHVIYINLLHLGTLFTRNSSGSCADDVEVLFDNKTITYNCVKCFCIAALLSVKSNCRTLTSPIIWETCTAEFYQQFGCTTNVTC